MHLQRRTKIISFLQEPKLLYDYPADCKDLNPFSAKAVKRFCSNPECPAIFQLQR